MPVDTSMVDPYGFYSRYSQVTGKPSNSRSDGKEWHGSCPRCGGRDRFAFWESGRFSCSIRSNGCGWHGSSPYWFLRDQGQDHWEACEELNISPDSEYSPPEKIYTPPDALTPPCKQWQERAAWWVHQAQQVLWSKYGEAVLAELRRRGFTDSTIRESCLGYIPFDPKQEETKWIQERYEDWGLDPHNYPDKEGNPKEFFKMPEGLLLPCYIDGVIWSITVRLFKSAKWFTDTKYLPVVGSVDAIYNVDAICSDTPAVLCESALDALSGIQTCQGLNVAFVATGSTTKAHDPLWIARINKAPYTLIAFDDDEEKNGKRAGDEGAKFWRSVLSRSMQVLPWKHDLNQTLQDGLDLREWVTLGIQGYEAIQESNHIASTLVEETYKPEPTYQAEPIPYVPPVIIRYFKLGNDGRGLSCICSQCGKPATHYGHEAIAYCEQCWEVELSWRLSWKKHNETAERVFA